MGDTTGKFTVSEVEERTGVPGSSLRQWERRYGFPAPARSESGYRYYSELDVQAVMRIRDLVRDGVPPSRATAMVQSSLSAQAAGRAPAQLAQDLTDALLQLDAERAERSLSEALGLHPLDTVLLEVVRPALVRIGDLWHAGEVSVALEHFASNLLQGRLRGLLRLMAGSGGGPRVVVACVPGEQHELGALIMAVMLRRAGFQLVYLGADTPLEDLAELAQVRQADAVLLSITGAGALQQLSEAAADLSGLPGLLVLGGQAVAEAPEVASQVGGVFLGNDLRKVVPELQTLLVRGR